MLIDDKTELVLIGHPKRLPKIHDFVLLKGINKVKPSPCPRNLGVYFDSALSFKTFVQKRSCCFLYRSCSVDHQFLLLSNRIFAYQFCESVRVLRRGLLGISHADRNHVTFVRPRFVTL